MALFNYTLIVGYIVTDFKLARREGLAADDAAYLELTLRLNLPLATLDSRLGEAASGCGVSLVVFDYFNALVENRR